MNTIVILFLSLGGRMVRWWWVNCQFRGVGGGRVVQWCWANFQCRGVLLIWIRVGQGPYVLIVDAGGVVWTFFSRLSFLFLSPSLWETTRYRLKYCLKGPLSSKERKVPGRRNLDCSRARAYFACSKCGFGLLGQIYYRLSFLFFLPLSGRRTDVV